MTFFDYSFVADHFQYLAAIGPLALAGPRVDSFFTSFSHAGIRAVGNDGDIPAHHASEGLTWLKACAYENEETLWNDTLAHNPAAWMGYNNLGMLRTHQGRNEEAMAFFQKSLADQAPPTPTPSTIWARR